MGLGVGRTVNRSCDTSRYLFPCDFNLVNFIFVKLFQFHVDTLVNFQKGPYMPF